MGPTEAALKEDTMGKRSAVATSEVEAASLTPSELDQQIALLKFRIGSRLSASLRRQALKRLVWLEEQREQLYGVPAPKRRF
jgi:hypothetical protein